MDRPLHRLSVAEMRRSLARHDALRRECQEQLPSTETLSLFKELLEELGAILPIVADLRKDTLKASHWAQLRAILGAGSTNETDLCLRLLLSYDIVSRADAIHEVARTADEEFNLETAVADVEMAWNRARFGVKRLKNGVKVFTNLDDMAELVESNFISLTSLRSNRHGGAARHVIESLTSRLVQMEEVLAKMKVCQQHLTYIGSLFETGDLQRELPSDAVEHRRIMEST